jgi:SAM-dependent methyltransferase
MASAQIDSPETPPVTYWESTAETRWGRYVTQLEHEALMTVASEFAQPGVGLEIGCEGGRWCRMLADLGWQMTATDVNASAVRMCQERNPAVNCIVVDPNDKTFPAATESIDLLVCMEVEAVTNSEWFFDEAARVLRTGGRLVGTHSNLLSWRGAIGKLRSTVRGSYEFYATTYGHFRHALINRGFTISEEQGCCWPPFERDSNSRAIPAAVAIEQALGLRRLPAISPWIVYRATRA